MSRAGLHPLLAQPAPRLNLDDLLVHTVPLDTPKPSNDALLAYEGDPPPDRGGSLPWPDQGLQEG
jgi:hypothetical protein